MVPKYITDCNYSFIQAGVVVVIAAFHERSKQNKRGICSHGSPSGDLKADCG